jgi:hypothetical protein
MVYVLVPWVCFSVLFCLALMRAAVTPQPDFEEAGVGLPPEAAIPSRKAVEFTTASPLGSAKAYSAAEA